MVVARNPRARCSTDVGAKYHTIPARSPLQERWSECSQVWSSPGKGRKVQGKEIYDVLGRIGAARLHHANSVITSCTFLEQRGLLSRGYVDDHGLKQTPQGSDQKDKEYGIWHRVFLDHVDIHDRGGRKKGANLYGPAPFVLDLGVLLSLPVGTDIKVTKSNPVHWHNGQSESDRWFQAPEELAQAIRFGDFDKMLVIQTPTGRLDFPNRATTIVLDDPQRCMSSGEDAYTHSENRLKRAAGVGNVATSITQRTCPDGCRCVEKYARYDSATIDFYFG